MREALRRILWLIPTVFVVSLGVFWLLSRLQAPGAESDDEPIPLFFNPAPGGVSGRARMLADHIAAAKDTSGIAAAQLVKLGGAALPSLIPYFDSLPPQGRARVAFALVPLATRMGIWSSQDLDDPEAAVLFWTRYWADHAIDFRATAVARTVARIIQRPSPARRAEIQELDTFALDALIHGMTSAESVEALSTLTDLAAHVSGVDQRVSPNASWVEARRIADTWQDWWVGARARYVNYDGGSRALGMFQETRYGRWITRSIHGRFSGQGDDVAAPRVTQKATVISFTLLLAGLIGGYVAGPLLAAFAVALAAEGGRSAIVAVCLLLTSFPSAAALSWLGARAFHGFALGALLMFIFGAGLIGLYQYQAIRDASSSDSLQTHRAFGASRLRAALTALRGSGLLAVAHLANRGPSLFTGICIVEYALALPGLGQMTVNAIRNNDVSWLMLSACLSTLLAGLLQIAGNLWLKRLTPSQELC